MFIQTEATPNPATLKFLPGETVVQNGPFEFVSAEEAAGKSPLAERLFSIPSVCGVFFGFDFVTGFACGVEFAEQTAEFTGVGLAQEGVELFN